MDQKWLVKRTNREFIQYLSRSSAVSSLTAQVLVNRGIKTPDQARAFLNPHIRDMSDPFDIPDMDRAVERIRRAARLGERVLVHGDYDADGTTATAVLLWTLRTMGIECDCFIPNRFDHGYGFHRSSIDIARSKGVSLIITVDCGINAFDEAAEAAKEGIDVIITDHHEPSIDCNGAKVKPDCVAAVNPKLASPGARNPLSGAGVVLMISIALMGREESAHLFDLAAIGSLADMVPLIGDNRIIISHGLSLINKDTRDALKCIRAASGVSGKTINTTALSFTIIPRINASGRIADASEVVKLFTTGNTEEARRIAQDLNRINARRQMIEESVFQGALSLMKRKDHGQCIVLHHDGWHEGVIGIVASKISELYRKPTFIFSIRKGVALGSARSKGDIDLSESLHLCSDILIRYGGHRQAAGLTMRADRLDVFERKMNDIILDAIRREKRKDELMIDAEVRLDELSFPLLKELNRLEPYGMGNAEPLFASRNLDITAASLLKKSHIKMKLRDDLTSIDAIGFHLGERYREIESLDRIDAAFVPTINEWNRSRKLQLTIKAFRPSP